MTETTAEPVMCATPDDCPNGPEPHEFAPPDVLYCCCMQPWEKAPTQ